MAVKLDDYQIEAVKKLDVGKVLCGNVGSGKSITALAYYYILNGGKWNCLLGVADFEPLPDKKCVGDVLPLYIITTAKKRDDKDWEYEASRFLLNSDDYVLKVDSWHNVAKYTEVRDSFFIFDEQRLVGSGLWVKSFYKIARHNKWILLTATPGDNLSDYIPLFVANGFYKNATEFKRRHIVYKPYITYPVIDRYVDIARPIRLRKWLLVKMDYSNQHECHNEYVKCTYDKKKYDYILHTSEDPDTGEMLETANAECIALRRVVNSDSTRIDAIEKIILEKMKVIIFYNYDFELENLINFFKAWSITYAQWNGHKHQQIPEGEMWAYLVQYNAGAEGWNCVTCDTIIFYSQTYSYKQLVQAKGRIDRRTSPFKDLYYYHLISNSSIDKRIKMALLRKKKFNESVFIRDVKH